MSGNLKIKKGKNDKKGKKGKKDKKDKKGKKGKKGKIDKKGKKGKNIEEKDENEKSQENKKSKEIEKIGKIENNDYEDSEKIHLTDKLNENFDINKINLQQYIQNKKNKANVDLLKEIQDKYKNNDGKQKKIEKIIKADSFVLNPNSYASAYINKLKKKPIEKKEHKKLIVFDDED